MGGEYTMLVQKSKFVIRTFKITENGLLYGYKRFFFKHDKLIKFEDIPENQVSFSVFPKKSFIAAIIFTLISAMMAWDYLFASSNTDKAEALDSLTFYSPISCFFWIMFWFNYNTYTSLSDHKTDIVFFENIPSSEKVHDFIKELQQAKEKYINQKYYNHIHYHNLEPSSISAEIFRLSQLKEQNIISEEEFNEIKKELIQSKKNEEKTIGFMR